MKEGVRMEKEWRQGEGGRLRCMGTAAHSKSSTMEVEGEGVWGEGAAEVEGTWVGL